MKSESTLLYEHQEMLRLIREADNSFGPLRGLAISALSSARKRDDILVAMRDLADLSQKCLRGGLETAGIVLPREG